MCLQLHTFYSGTDSIRTPVCLCVHSLFVCSSVIRTVNETSSEASLPPGIDKLYKYKQLARCTQCCSAWPQPGNHCLLLDCGAGAAVGGAEEDFEQVCGTDLLQVS